MNLSDIIFFLGEPEKNKPPKQDKTMKREQNMKQLEYCNGTRLRTSDGTFGFIDSFGGAKWEDGDYDPNKYIEQQELQQWIHNFKEFIHNYEGVKIVDNFGEIGFIDEEGEIYWEHGALDSKLYDTDLSYEEMNTYINNYVSTYTR